MDGVMSFSTFIELTESYGNKHLSFMLIEIWSYYV